VADEAVLDYVFKKRKNPRKSLFLKANNISDFCIFTETNSRPAEKIFLLP
jgi:hypothetical protein